MKCKSETCDIVIHFITQVEKQTNSHVKIFQSDGGTEYKPLKDYFSKRGIIHRITCPYTSKQNGLVERKHRHVLEIGLTLLANAKMPLKFWPESFSTAVYLINRLPTKVLKGNNPHEKLLNVKPDYHYLKTFGCLCYPYTRPYNRNKLDFRSKPCTFIGYAQNQNGYKCLDENGKVFISMHVVFNERIFPYQFESIKTTNKMYDTSVSIPSILVYSEIISADEQVHDNVKLAPSINDTDQHSDHNRESPVIDDINDNISDDQNNEAEEGSNQSENQGEQPVYVPQATSTHPM